VTGFERGTEFPWLRIIISEMQTTLVVSLVGILSRLTALLRILFCFFFLFFKKNLSIKKKARLCATLWTKRTRNNRHFLFWFHWKFQNSKWKFQIFVVFFCNLEKKNRIADNFKIKIKWEKLEKWSNLPIRRVERKLKTFDLGSFHSRHHRSPPLTWSQLKSRRKSSKTTGADCQKRADRRNSPTFDLIISQYFCIVFI
jgi:hypothetical protein